MPNARITRMPIEQFESILNRLLQPPYTDENFASIQLLFKRYTIDERLNQRLRLFLKNIVNDPAEVVLDKIAKCIKLETEQGRPPYVLQLARDSQLRTSRQQANPSRIDWNQLSASAN